MFDLESSITKWRRQMLAAGITSPSPIEELETHLREEIERQMRSGLDEAGAFCSAVEKIGQAGPLKKEFSNVRSFIDKFGRDKTERINRALGLVWMVYCLGSFYKTTTGLTSAFNFPDFHFTPLFLLGVAFDFIYLRGLVASVLLFGGSMAARRFIMFLAILDTIGGVAVLALKPLQPLSLAYTVVGFVTIWLLWPSQKSKSITA